MGSSKKLDELEARAFADMVMSGPCPTCGSDSNVHSCEYNPEDPNDSVVGCEIAKAIDSPVTVPPRHAAHCSAPSVATYC